MKKSIFLTVLLGLFLVSTAIADPGDVVWTRTYGGPYTDHGHSIQQTTDGGYIVTGQTNDFISSDVWLLKLDADGDTLWTRTYGGSSAESGYSVQQTTDGGYILVGFTMSFSVGLMGVYLVKTDANGDSLWSRTYGGSLIDGGHFVRQTADGGYIVAGENMSFGAGNMDFWLLKLDASGDTLWTRTYGGSLIDQAWCVEQTSDGGYIIVGHTDSFGEAGRNFYIVKTDANGDTLWTRAYGGSANDLGRSVQQTPDGGYIVAGIAYSFGAGDVWLLKLDSSGDTLWTRTYGTESVTDYAESVQLTTDGGYIVAGMTNSFGAGNQDIWLLKTDANGDTLWTRAYGGLLSEYGQCVQQTTDGGYVIAGYGTVASYYDVYIVKVEGESSLPEVTIEILPDNPPVTVPQGGSFGFTGSLTNNTEDPQVADAWTMAVGPQKETYGPFKELNDIELEPLESRTADFNQRVPNMAPLGFYDYIAYCGDYPSTVMDSSFFQIEVVAGEFTEAGQGGWVLTGSFLQGDLADLPSEFALLSNYPNPFNATTVISYQLPVSSSVKLEVYNILGNKVATLIDGEQEAGYRSVTWDASEVSSGIYFYKLSAGGFLDTNRMILLK